MFSTQIKTELYYLVYNVLNIEEFMCNSKTMKKKIKKTSVFTLSNKKE